MAIPGFPDVVVEAAWPTANPFDAAPTWVDITADVERIRIKRSSPDSSTQADPSTCDIVVRNTTGAYDPTLPANLNIDVGKRIRVRGLWSATYYGRFDGYTDKFVEAWDEANQRPLMVIQCVDLLETLLARAAHDPTSYRDLVLAAAPTAYWRMGMGPGVTTIPDEVSGGAANAGGLGALLMLAGATPVKGAIDADRDTGTTLGIADSDQQRIFTGGAASVVGMSRFNSWAISGWFKSNQGPSSGVTQYIVHARGGAGGDYCFEASVNSSGAITIWQGKPSPLVTTNTATTSGVNIVDGYWHHIMWRRVGGSHQLYVDGVLELNVAWSNLDYGTGGGAGNTQLSWVWIGYAGWGGGGWTGDIDEMAWWWNVTPPTTHAALAWANARGRWIGQHSVDRVSLLCTLLGVPAARMSLPAPGTGKLLAEPEDIVTTPTGDIIRQAILTEEGQLWVDGSGQIRMRLRRSGDLPVATQTYGPENVPTAGPPKVSMARDDVTNEVSVQAPLLKDVVVQNAASIAAYAIRGQLPKAGSGAPSPSVSTELTNVDDQLDMATRLATMLGEPGPKVDSVSVASSTAAAGSHWPYLLGTEPFDVVRVKRPTTGGVARPDVVAEIAAIDENIMPGQWDFTFTLRRNYTQPVPHSRLWSQVATTLLNAAWTPVALTGRRDQADDMVSSTDPTKLFCRTAGPYVVHGNLWVNVGAGLTFGVGLLVNGTTFIATKVASTNALPLASVATVWRFNAGDYVQLVGYHNAGASAPSVVATNYSAEMSMALLR